MFALVSIRSRMALAALTCALAPEIWGQATTSLRGTVTDAQGAAIDAAIVTLQNAAVGFRRSALTDATGVYQFSQVPPGVYSVGVEKSGFASVNQETWSC
jgi:protocatechuate 3,4-dioxygenase beta subunit